MMNFYKYLFLITFSFASISLQASVKDSTKLEVYMAANDIEAIPVEEGLFYTIEEEGSGAFPKKGDYVMLNYKGILLDSTVFDESITTDPFIFQLGYRQVIRGWDKGLPFFQVGSKGKLFIPSDLAYGRFGAGKMIPPDADLIFEVEVLDIMDDAAYDKYMVALEEKERMAYEQHIKDQFRTDKKLIQDYAISHKIKSKRTDSGLSYSIVKKGKGDIAQVGDELSVQYEGYLINDELFDSNKGKKPFTFPLGKNKVIKGWDEGLQYFQEGSEGWLMIPSKLAYGSRSIEEEVDGKIISIPEDSVLIFYVKVLGIKKAASK